MGLSAGTGWRAFGLGLFSYGRAAIFRCPPFLRLWSRAVRPRDSQGDSASRFVLTPVTCSECGPCVVSLCRHSRRALDRNKKEAATLPFWNVAAVWALRPVVRLSLSVRSRRCPAGCCCVRRRRRYSNCRSVPLRPPRRRAGSQRSRSPSAVRSCRPKPRSSSSCPSTAGARTRRRPPLPT